MKIFEAILEISRDIAMGSRTSDLTWLIPLLVGSLLTIFISKINIMINEKSEDKKILNSLKYEIFENFIKIKEILSEYNQYKEISKQLLIYEEFCSIPKFKTDTPKFKKNIYEKAREKGVIAGLPTKTKETIFFIYNKITEILLNSKKEDSEFINKISELHDYIKTSGILRKNSLN
jgi:hypothetical protein